MIIITIIITIIIIIKIEWYFLSYLHNVELHDGTKKRKGSEKNWGEAWKGRGKCSKQRGNYIQNQTINRTHTTTKKHKNIIYLKNNKGVIQV